MATGLVKGTLGTMRRSIFRLVSGAGLASSEALGDKMPPLQDKAQTPLATGGDIVVGQTKAPVSTNLYGDPLPRRAVARRG